MKRHKFLISCNDCLSYHFFKGETRKQAKIRAQMLCKLIEVNRYEITYLIK